MPDTKHSIKQLDEEIRKQLDANIISASSKHKDEQITDRTLRELSNGKGDDEV